MNSLIILALAKATIADVAVKPRPIGNAGLWILSEDYPFAALTAEMEGVTSVVMRVSDQGMVDGCTVTESSGWPILDDMSCNLLKLRARYEPAKDRRNRPVAMNITQRINWQLPHDADAPTFLQLPPPTPFSMIVDYHVDATGAVADCKVRWASGVPGNPDPCADLPAVRMEPFRNLVGDPVAKRVTFRASVSIEDPSPRDERTKTSPPN